MFLLMVVFLGTVALFRMELTLLPDIKAEEIIVWLAWPDAGVEEIEDAVARPAEEALVSARGVNGVRTRIVPGGAAITVMLNRGVDPELAALSVRERLDTVRWILPEDAERPVVLGASGRDNPDMVLALSADDLAGAADWARTVLKPRLEQVAGVARAQIVGAPSREIRVIPDEARMAALGIDGADLGKALAAANVRAPGGTLRRRGIRYALQINSELTSADDIRAVIVSPTDGPPVRVADVADVVDGFEDPRGWSRLDGRPAVGILVHRESGANLVAMSRDVLERLGEVKNDFPGFDVAVVADPSPFVRQSMAGVWQSVWWGGLLAFVVLIYFLRDFRSPLLLITALPVSVVGTFAVLDLCGVSLNLMSLGGVALGIGMLVDNGIIVLENIHRLRVEEGMSRTEAAVRGAEEVSLPVLASTLTTCAVFAPLAFVPGAVGALFRDQAISVGASLGVSLLVALSFLPMAAARLEPSARGTERMPFFGVYRTWLDRGLRRPGLALGITAMALAASTLFLFERPREILPPLSTDQVSASLRLPPGTDVTATGEAAVTIETWLRARPEVASTFLSVGEAGALDPTDAGQQSSRAVLRARLHHGASGKRERLLAELRAAFPNHDGRELTVMSDRSELSALVPAGLSTLSMEILGPDPDAAERFARDIAERASARLKRGGEELSIAATELEPRYVLTPLEDRWWRLGLTESDITAALRSRTSGLETTRIRRFQEEFPVVIRPAGVEDPGAGTLLVDGRSLPVRELFSVATVLSPARLLREGQARVASLRWDGPMRNVDTVREALDAARAEAAVPANYVVRYGGSYEEMRRTLSGIMAALGLSAGLVLLILAAQFESLKLPLLIFAAVPLSLVGVAATLLVTRGTINVFSGIGLVILVGIVVNDSILKVDLLSRLRRSGMSVSDAIHTASRRRYRPIIMTTLTTVFAMAPLLHGAGSEFRAPLAATVIGGLTASTLLTLLIIPVLFQVVAGRRRRGA